MASGAGTARAGIRKFGWWRSWRCGRTCSQPFDSRAYSTGETTLAREVWGEIPENSLTIVDRNFLVKKDLIHLETSGNRHWLSRTKTNTRWAVTKKLGKDDYLAEWDVHETGLPGKWEIRVIH